MNKDTKIWGMSFSLIGDLIAGLPQLNYFEKKYPGSYKYWGIHKKMSHAAPLFYNHPLIDRIKITDTWGGFGENDYELASQCEFTTRQLDHKNKTLLNARPEDYWYNDHDIVEQLARMSGIYDIQEVLKGFHDRYALTELELSKVVYLMCVRSCITLTMAAYRMKLFPENNYISVDNNQAFHFLSRMKNEDLESWSNALVDYCGA